MKHILVAYEEREVSDRMLEKAAELAKAFEAKVTVTSVAPILAAVGHGIGPYDPADPPERHRREAVDAVLRLENLGVHGATAVPLVGDPADEIVTLAESRKCDLVVVGAHEGGLLTRFFSTSISDAVAHHSPVDVLVVH